MTQRTDISELELSGSPNLKRALARPSLDSKRHDAGTPDAPDHLTRPEVKVFKRVAKLLEARNVITPGDCESIAQYAVVFVRWQRERELLDSEGTVLSKLVKLNEDHLGEYTSVINPRLKVVRGCELQLAALSRELCLTVRTRGSVKPTKQEKTADDTLAEIDAMLAGVN